ncbi:MAG: proton-conducting transporter membrane subunit [Pirellulales bacterium]
MNELHLPWLELSVAVPSVGALIVGRLQDSDRARLTSLIISAVTLLLTIGAWIDFGWLHGSSNVFSAHDHWNVFAPILGDKFFVIDELSGPLLPLTSLLFFLTQLATTRGKARRFSFSWTLVSLSAMLATLSCEEPWGIIALMAIGILPVWIELRARRKPTRVFELHMGLFIVSLVLGWFLTQQFSNGPLHTVGLVLLVTAVLVRSGACPLHCWITDLFEHASFGTALLFMTPMIGVYAVMRLILPVVPDSALHTISLLSLATALYAAGMSLVQREARRFFCFIFLSHSSLILIGLETATTIGLAAALLVWVSVSLSLTGFGLTLRSVESRTGRLLLTEYRGLADQMPHLAACFLLTGLASVGFPGTSGFIATELLVEAAIDNSSIYGFVVVLAAALNGVAVLFAYFKIFTGTRHHATIPLRSRVPEFVAVTTLFVLIIAGGLIPQPGVDSRYHAAEALLKARDSRLVDDSQHESTHSNESEHH